MKNSKLFVFIFILILILLFIISSVFWGCELIKTGKETIRETFAGNETATGKLTIEETGAETTIKETGAQENGDAYFQELLIYDEYYFDKI